MPPVGVITQIRGHLSRALYPALGRAIAAVLHHRIRTGGLVIDTHSPHITPTTVARLFLGRYEAPEVKFIRQTLPRHLDVVELGASIGVTTAHIARRLEPERRLICVEANPHLIPLIKDNVARNAPGRPLTVLNQAIDYSGQRTVRLAISATNTNSRLSADGGGQEVEATTLSRLIQQFGLGDFALVVDIEGAELDLILNDQPALRQVQHLLIELHAATRAGELWLPDRLRAALLAQHGFRPGPAQGQVQVFDRPAARAA